MQREAKLILLSEGVWSTYGVRVSALDIYDAVAVYLSWSLLTLLRSMALSKNELDRDSQLHEAHSDLLVAEEWEHAMTSGVLAQDDCENDFSDDTLEVALGLRWHKRAEHTADFEDHFKLGHCT